VQGHRHGGEVAVVLVSEPGVLAELEKVGFDLGSLWLGQAGSAASQLAEHAAYRVLSKAVEAEIARAKRRDPKAGVGMRFGHRVLDASWLEAERMRFQLIGIANRLDRRVFEPEHCGETRFIYRLAYRAETASGPIDSRLPFTLNLVSYQPAAADGSCAAAARRWLQPAGADELAWLVSEQGPLAPSVRAGLVAKSLEVNFQSVRWPSTIRPAMAGHAEYALLAFDRLPSAPYLKPRPLENTIDSARLAKNAALRGELLSFLRTPEALAALDSGTLLVPDKFLATSATSVSPHGLARRANRAYGQTLRSDDLSDLDLKSYKTIQSPAALIRRLDTLTCAGCHQSRSIAGFHMLGVEPASDYVDAVAVPMSAHLHDDMARRAEYVSAVARGQAPDEHRAPAERAALGNGRGEHCGLGDPGFASWTCADGLRCVPMADDEVGACAPEARLPGDPCERGTVRASSDPHRDGMTLAEQDGCGARGVCEQNSVGFPGGMCAGGCEDLPPGAVCGGIALLREFNSCLAARTPFDRCLAENTRPGALQACGFKTPCRDDYVCTRLPDGAPGEGACLPPYFLFQLRIDGHVL
jgi:hypothetical protein